MLTVPFLLFLAGIGMSGGVLFWANIYVWSIASAGMNVAEARRLYRYRCLALFIDGVWLELLGIGFAVIRR